MECKKESNIKFCNCSYACNKHGVCCDCLAYHRKHGELPACYFPNDIEKGYNRSIDNFVNIVKERGTSYLR
ncbi:MAG: hypothetical protein EHM93_09940 [Bacteroidales bacterium]|nr:MAG: hypothetical protein EHM93_09940 [Bacteroidales bacterium]